MGEYSHFTTEYLERVRTQIESSIEKCRERMLRTKAAETNEIDRLYSEINNLKIQWDVVDVEITSRRSVTYDEYMKGLEDGKV